MPKVIHTYVKAITALNKALFILAAALMAIIVPVMMFEVVSRYAFNAPTVWGMELAVLLFGPYFLLGGPYLLHLGGHVNMDLFRSRMSLHTGRIADIFNQFVILFFCAVMLYYATPLALQAMAYRETTFSAWNPPLWPYKLAVPVSMLLLGLQSVAELCLLCLNERQGDAA